MKREDVSKIFAEATAEQIDKILDLNSADIGKAKKGFDDLKAELDTAKQTITDINKQYDDLKAANASAEDYKTKYDELVADNKRKADEQAARELEAAERAEFDGYFTEQKKEWYREYREVRSEMKKFQLAQEITRTFLNEEQQMPKGGLIER